MCKGYSESTHPEMSDTGAIGMSGKRNPHEKPKSRTIKKARAHSTRTTYTNHADAVKAAKRRGGKSRAYKVKGGYRITER